MKTLLLFVISLNICFASSDCLINLKEFLSEKGLIKYEEKIGSRGFVANSPALSNQEDINRSIELGIVGWRLEITPITDIESALKHHQAEENNLKKKVYFLSNQKEINKMNASNANDEFKKQSKNKLFWFDNDTLEIKYVAEENVEKYFKDFSFAIMNNEPRLYLNGFTIPYVRGVLYYDDFIKSKSTKKTVRALKRAGYSIKFNSNFDEVINLLKNQTRVGQTSATNRYADTAPGVESPATKLFREKIKQGLAITTEIYDPNGILIAGNNNFISNKIFTGDSVFSLSDYVIPESVKSVIGTSHFDANRLRRAADLALSDYLNQHGIEFSDIGMVTNYSKSIKGKEIPFEDFLELMDTLKENPYDKINFDKVEWNPTPGLL